MTGLFTRLRKAASVVWFIALGFNSHAPCQAFPSSHLIFVAGKTTFGRKNGTCTPTCLFAIQDGERRRALSRIALYPSVLVPTVTIADEEVMQDMTSKLFNPDGSLKEGVADEAKSRTIETTWPVSDGRIVNVDGVNAPDVPTSDQKIRISYRLPEKWEQGDRLYLDKSEGVNRKACNHITAYQAPGIVLVDRLEKATIIGVAKALDAPDSMKALQYGDVIGGRKQRKGDQTYFEFDLAVAPEACGTSQKNLGLGFCPYDTIFLLSATIFEERLYVLAVECDDDEWKQASSDLKRVRSSFKVEIF